MKFSSMVFPPKKYLHKVNICLTFEEEQEIRNLYQSLYSLLYDDIPKHKSKEVKTLFKLICDSFKPPKTLTFEYKVNTKKDS